MHYSPSPIRCDLATYSVRFSDIFLWTAPSESLLRSFYPVLLGNDLSSAVLEAQSIDDNETRRFSAWLLSQVVHERVHVYQSLVAPIAASMVRRCWQTILNVPALLGSYSLQGRFRSRIGDNVDSFYQRECKFNAVEQLAEFHKFLEKSARLVSGKFSPIVRNHLAQIWSGYANSSETELRTKRHETCSLNSIQLLELWAIIVQIGFLKRHFPGDVDYIYATRLAPAVRKGRTEFFQLLEGEFGVVLSDKLCSDAETLFKLVPAILFALAPKLGPEPRLDIDPMADPGSRFGLALFAIRNSYSSDGSEAFDQLVRASGETSDLLGRDVANDVTIRDRVLPYVQPWYTSLEEQSRFLDATLKLRVGAVSTELSILFDSERFLDHMVQEFSPPLILESWSGYPTDSIGYAELEKYFDESIRLDEAPTKIQNSKDTYLTNRFLCRTQNVLPDAYVAPDSSEATFYKRLINVAEPLYLSLLYGLSYKYLFDHQRRLLISTFEEIGELVEPRQWRLQLNADLVFFAEKREIICDLCGKPVDRSECLITQRNVLRLWESEQLFAPLAIVEGGYSIVHRTKCFDEFFER